MHLVSTFLQHILSPLTLVFRVVLAWIRAWFTASVPLQGWPPSPSDLLPTNKSQFSHEPDFWQQAMRFLRVQWTGTQANQVYNGNEYLCYDKPLRWGVTGLNLAMGLLSITLAQAQTCSLTLKSTVSGCYSVTGASKTTVSVEVAWENIPLNPNVNDGSDIITVTFGGQTKAINPGNYFTPGGNGTIISPQVVAFEVTADASTKTAQVFIGSSYTVSTCKAQQTGIVLPAACPPTVCATGQTGGTVFNDFNADGIKQTGEISGLAGITVQAFDCNGMLVGTATTDAYGKYAFTGLTAASYPIRVEFSNLPTFAGQGTMNGTDGRTTTQFVNAADCNVDLGVLDPTDYCQTSPQLLVPCYVSGDPLVAGTAGSSDAVVAFDYDVTGANSSAVSSHAITSQVGTLWGMAYNKFTKKVFSAATVKRHSGLGPLGLGGIYVSDFRNKPANGTTFNYTDFIDVSTIGINVGSIVSNAARGLVGVKGQPSTDNPGYLAAGKLGIGGIDLSEDGNTLYLINLFDNKLYEIDITAYNTGGTLPTAGNVKSYDMSTGITCTGGSLHAWAVKVRKGKVYTGMVCDAGNSQNKSDLRAFVQELNGSTVSTIFDFPLTYPKGFSFDGITGWFPWTDSWASKKAETADIVHPEPLFTAIEFDVDGSMVLGFGDRTAIQSGVYNYAPVIDGKVYNGYVGGDILRAYSNGTSYVLENNAKAGPSIGYGADNYQGPGSGEFYNDDFRPGTSLIHAENSLGGLALRPGSGEVINVAMDPLNSTFFYNSGGIRRLSNQTGLLNSAFVLYTTSATADGTFGKAAGLGDVVLLCSTPTYLEIGNRLWVDIDKDGIQDPCEKALAGVNVSLFKGTTLIATTKTDVNGEYYFNNSPVSSTLAGTVSTTAILPNTAYTVRFGTDGATNQYDAATDILTTSIGKFKVTTAFSTAPTANTTNDSNAQLSGGFLVASVTTGAAGSVNHTIDAGFVCVPTTVSSVNVVKPTCPATTPNNDGKILLSGIVSADKVFLVTAGSSIPSYTATGSQPVSNSTASFTGLANPATAAGQSYSLVLYNGPCCYTVVTAQLPQQTCIVLASLGNYVFEDVNANGIQEATDKPIPGVTVSLLSSGTLVATTTTNASGLYSFTGLTPGKPYSVSFTAPAGFTATVQNAAGSTTATDSDGNPATGLTGIYSLTADENNTTIDMGYYQPASLGDKVFADVNKNGIQDTGDTPIPNVTVTLVSNGTVVATTTTASSGTAIGCYSFTGITPGKPYSVSFTTPANYTATSSLVGSDKTNDSDPVNGITAPVTLISGENNLTLDAGFYLLDTPTIQSVTVCAGSPASLTLIGCTGSIQWTGPNITSGATASILTVSTLAGSAIQQVISYTALCSSASSPLVATLTVNPLPTVSATSATICAGQSTSLTASGASTYQWSTGANTASIQVSPTTTTGYSVTGTTLAGCSATASGTVTVNGQPQISSISQSTACVGNVASLTVNATNTGAGTLEYSLNGGTFQASNRFTLTAPTNTTAVVVVRTMGSNCTATESVVVNCACATPVSLTFVPSTMQTCAGSPVSFTVGVSGASSASLTSNGSGTFSQTLIASIQRITYTPSVTDASAGSVTLTLTSADPDGVGSCVADQITRVLTISPAPGVSVTSASICAGESTLLTASGASTYLWSNGATTQSISVSVAGTYSVTGTSAQGCTASTSGTLTLYATPSLSPASLPGGVVGVPYSQTLSGSGGLAPYTYSVVAGSLPAGLSLNPTTGVLSGMPTSAIPASFTVRVTDAHACTATLPYTTGAVTASLGDYVFEDVNANGIQEATDKPIPGVTVSLLSSGTLVATTTTNAIGLYSFIGLTPGKPYSVSFTAPAGFTATVQNTGATDKDSDGNPATGLTGIYSLTANENNTTVDMGFVPNPGVTVVVVRTPVCNVLTNNYTATSTVSLTNVQAGMSLTLTDNGTSLGVLSLTAGQTTASFPVSGISDGSSHTVVATLTGGTSASTTYRAPVSCLGTPVLLLTKLVSKTKAQLGEVISYTVVLMNSGPVAATSVVVNDTFSQGISLVPGSAATSLGGFTPGGQGGIWTIASLPANSTATLTYSASLTAAGVVYNTASIPGNEVTTCTSVPITVCPGSAFSVKLTAPAGFSRYQWYLNGTVIALATGATYTATQVGEYTIRTDQGQCPNGLCCPTVIEFDRPLSFAVLAQAPSCAGGQPRNDGQLTVVGLGAPLSQYQYAITEGSRFTALNPTLSGVPATGILASNLVGDRTYTVRIYNASGCYQDQTVQVLTNCTCPTEVCIPIVVRKSRVK